jgi:hypothetical protein
MPWAASIASAISRQVLGIGTELSDEEWREAHAIAFYASKARQARPGS